jgi:restriction system protein
MRRPEIQAFYGALAGQRAKKGVFITTSSFTPHATDFATSVDGVVLVDAAVVVLSACAVIGLLLARLASLMLEHGIGVASRAITVPKVDSDYFERIAA